MTSEQRKEIIQKLIESGTIKFKGKDKVKALVANKQNKVQVNNLQENKPKVEEVAEQEPVQAEQDAALEFLEMEPSEGKTSEEVLSEARAKAKERLTSNEPIYDQRVISGLYHIVRSEPGAFVDVVKGRIDSTVEAIRNSKGEPFGKEQLDSLNTTLKFITLATEVDRFDASATAISKNVDAEKAHKEMVSIKECLEDLAVECSRMGNTEQVKEFKSAITDGNVVLTTVESIIEEQGINEESLNKIVEIMEDAGSSDIDKIKDMVNDAVSNGQITGEVGETLDEVREFNEHPSFTDVAQDIVEPAVEVGTAVAATAAAGVALEGAAAVAGVVGGAIGTSVAIAGALVAADAMYPIVSEVINEIEQVMGIEPPVLEMATPIDNGNGQN